MGWWVGCGAVIVLADDAVRVEASFPSHVAQLGVRALDAVPQCPRSRIKNRIRFLYQVAG